MAILASITILDAAAPGEIHLITAPATCPVDALYTVAGTLEYYGAPEPVPVEAAEASIEALLGVVSGLCASCWREGDQALAAAIQGWLLARGRV